MNKKAKSVLTAVLIALAVIFVLFVAFNFFVKATDPSITVVKSPVNNPVNCSSNITFIINVTNSHDYNLTNVLVNDTGPLGVGIFYSSNHSVPQETYWLGGAYVAWLINVSANSTSQIIVNFTTGQAGNYTNHINVTNSSGAELTTTEVNYTIVGECGGGGGLIINLTSPDNGSTLTSAPFVLNFSVTGATPINCSLWGNFTGGWAVNQTKTNITDLMGLNFTIDSLNDDTYIWNVNCFNASNSSQGGWGNNRTFSVDANAPIVHLGYPWNNTVLNQSYESFDWNMSDAIQLKNITFYIWNSSGIDIYSDTHNVTGTYNDSNSSYFEYNFTSSGIYLWNFYGCDNSSNCAWSQEGNYSLNYTPLVNVVKYPLNSTVNCSSNITFIINVTNSHDYNLTNVLVNDTGPLGTGIFYSSNQSDPVESSWLGGVYVAWLLNISNGTTSQIIVNFTTGQAGNYTNHINVTNSSGAELASTEVNYSIIGNCGGGGNLTVNLTYPPEGYTFSSGPFILNYSVMGLGPVNCSLFGNFTGGWALNQTSTNVTMGGSNNTFNLSSLNNGSYVWNVNCSSLNSSNSTWADNRTFSVSTGADLMNTSIYSNDCGFNYVNESGEIIKYGGGEEVEINGYVNDSDLKNWSLDIYVNETIFNSSACTNTTGISINGTLCYWNTTQFCPVGTECHNVTLVLSVFDNAGHQNNISSNDNRINPIIIDNKYPDINETALIDFVKEAQGRWNATFNVSDEHLYQVSAYILNSSNYIVLKWDTLCNMTQNDTCNAPGSGTFLQEWNLGSCSLNSSRVPVHYTFNFETRYGSSEDFYLNAIPGCIKFNATSNYDCGEEQDNCAYEGEPNCKAYRWWLVYNMSVETGNGTLFGLAQENWCDASTGCLINTSLINSTQTKFIPQIDKYNGQGNFTKTNLSEITLYSIGNLSNPELVQNLSEGNYNFLVQARDYVWTSDSSWENLFTVDLTAPQVHFSWWNTTDVDQNMTESPIIIPNYKNFTKHADIFFSPNELTINFSANVSDSVGMEQTWGYGLVYVNLSAFDDFAKKGTCSGSYFFLTYNSSSGKWEGNCTLDSFNQTDILNHSGNGNLSNGSYVESFNVVFNAIDTYGNILASAYNTSTNPPQACEGNGSGPGDNQCMSASTPINLHDLGVLQIGGPGGGGQGNNCTQIDNSTSTNFNDEFDFNHLNFRISMKVNMSCYANQSGHNSTLLPLDFRKMIFWNFSSLDFSSPSVGRKIGNLLQSGITVNVLPPNVHGTSRIYVNSTAFIELNKTTTISLYHLPFTTQPEITSDPNATGVNISSIIWVSNGYESEFNAITGNLTFTVYGFTGYNVSDTVSPIIIPIYPTNDQNITNSTININFSTNGTGTPISRVMMILNGTSYSYNPDNQPPLYEITCNSTNGSELYLCNKTSQLPNGTYQAIITAWDYGEGTGNNATYLLNFSVQINESEPGTNSTTNLTLLNSGRPNVGDTIRFLINITNTGSANISNLSIVDTFDVNYNYTNASITPNSVYYENKTIYWNNLSVNLSQGQSYLLYVNFSANLTANNALNIVNSTVYYASGGSSSTSYSLSFEIGENVDPNIVFIDATTTGEGNYSRSSIWANVSVGDQSAISSVTIFLYNSTTLYNSSTNNSINGSNLYFFANFTDLPEGTYKLNATANDTWGNINSTGVRTITLDRTVPYVAWVSPTNITYTYTNITINIANNSDASSVWWDNGTANLSYTNVINHTFSQGSHTIVAYANDSAGNTNSSSRTFFIDSIAPSIDFGSGTETSGTTINRDSIIINITASDLGSGLKNLTIYFYNTSLISSNNSTSSPLYWNISSLGDGIYYFNATAYDNAGNLNYTETRNVTVSAVPPAITIISPLNQTYTSTTLVFNVSLSEQGSWCGLSLDGTANKSMTVNGNLANYTNSSMTQGNHDVIFSCNDTSGNMNFTSARYFFIDSIAPTYSDNLTSPALPTNYSSSQSYQFNILWNDTNGISSTILIFNGTNHTMNNSGGNYSYNFSSLAAGNYTYSFWANDSAGNSNSTLNMTYTINKASPTITALLNGAANNLTDIVYPNTINASGSTTGGTLAIYRNDTQINNGLNYTLGVGYYRFDFNVTGNENYSSSLVSLFASIAKATSAVILYLNNSQGNISIELGGYVWINATNTSQGDIYLYKNGTLINNGTSPLANYTPFSSTGMHNITAIYPATQNYSSSLETWWVNVTDTMAPTITLPVYTNATQKKNTNTLTLNISVTDLSTPQSPCFIDVNGTNQTIAYSSGWCNGTVALTNLMDGNKTISIYNNDSSGNMGLNNSYVVWVDTTVPTITHNSPSNNSYYNYAPYFNGTCTDTGSGISKIWTNLTEYSTILSSSPYNFTNTSSLTEKGYIVNLSCNDSTGNLAFVLFNFTYDKTNPAISYNPSSTDSGNYSRTWILVNMSCSDTNNNTVVFNWNGTNGTFDSNSGNNYWSNKTPLSDGGYTFYAWCNDSVGNSNGTSVKNVILDTTPPTITLPVYTNATLKKNTDTLTLNISVTDTNTPQSPCFIDVNGTNQTITYSSGWCNGTVALTGLGDGNKTIKVYDDDSLGNMALNDSYVVWIDTTNPVDVQGTNPVDNYNSTSSSVTFDMKCHDDTAVSMIQLWTNTTGTWHANYSNPSYTNNTWLNITVNNIPDGSNYKWAVYCNDTSENNNITINRTFRVDTTAPSITVLSPGNTSYYFPEQLITINFSASDLSNVSSLWYYNTTENVTFVNETYLNLTNGIYTFIFYANDSLNNLANKSITFSVTELAANQTILNDSGVTVGENTTELILPQNQSLSNVTIPSNITEAQVIILNLGQRVDSNGNMSFDDDVNLSRIGSSANYIVELPANIVIIGGSSWTGEFILPTIKSTSGLNAPTISGYTTTLVKVVTLGSSGELNFSSPVKIIIGGMSGKKAGWSRGSSFIDIPTICDNITNPALNSSVRECYNNASTDLIIWTLHFTDFAAYSSTAVSNPPPSGGGGGGGAAANATNVTNQTNQSQVNQTRTLKTGKELLITILGNGESQTFKFKNQEHSIKVVEITGVSATIEITSEPIVLILNVGESKEVDLDADGIKDISITLEKIENLKATLKINELTAGSEGAGAEQGKNLTWLWVAICIVIVAVFAALTVVLVRYKNKKPKREYTLI